MKPGLDRRDRRRGFTLLEMAVTVAILGLVFGAVGLFQVRSHDASSAWLARSSAETRARRAVARAAAELQGVGLTFLAPDPTSSLGTSTLTFQKPASVSDTGVVAWANPSSLVLQLETGELDNGADDDGDSLVDERSLVLTRDVGTAASTTAVLCSGVAEWLAGETGNGLDDNGNGVVDEAGFSIRRVGDLLTVRMTVQAPAAGGVVVDSTVETSVVLRN